MGINFSEFGFGSVLTLSKNLDMLFWEISKILPKEIEE